MPLTADQYQQLIILQVGDTTTEVLATNIGLIWTQYDTETDLGRRFLWTKIAAIDLVIGEARKGVNFKALDGASVSLSDLFDHLMAMRQAARDDLDRDGATANVAGAIGEITTTAPIPPPDGLPPDANNPRYRGWPYGRRQTP